MKISVKVKPNSKAEKIEKAGEGGFILYVKAPAKEGRANQTAIKLLSEYFDIPKSKITILKGQASKNKIVELLG